MKALITTILMQVLVINANAVLQPNWDRPLAQANEVQVLEASGWLANVQEVSITLTKNDSTQNLKLLLNLEGQNFPVEIQSQEVDSCNTEILTSKQYSEAFENDLKVTLEDHNRRFCEDYRPHQWEVTVEVLDQETQEVLGSLKLGANPRAVFTIQSLNPQVDEENKVHFLNDKDSDLTIVRITK